MIWNFCIRRPVFTIVLFLSLAVFGVFAYLRMPVQEMPDVEFPVVSVNVVWRGAAPEVIESEVIDPLEGEINTIEGLKLLLSTAREEAAVITAEFELWRDIDVAAQDVRDAVERARRLLPLDIESPIVRKLDMEATPIVWIALTGDQRWDDVSLTDYAENVLKRQVETISGVGQVIVGGSRKYGVRIKLDPEKLAAHHLTVQDVVEAVRKNNLDLPTGRLEGLRREFILKVRGQFSEAAPFNELIISFDSGRPVRLSDVGRAIDDVEDDRQLGRFSGEESIGLGIIKQSGANTVAVANAALSTIEKLSAHFPPGLKHHVAMDASEYVKENIRDLLSTIFLASLLVIFMVFFFLRTGRGTMITSLAIPTSLIIGLAAISLLGFSINVLTMLAFILAIGIVVDDAIVVLERNYYHMEQGADSMPAARVGTTEVAFPSIANTLSLCAVFIPVAFTGGLVGRFFFEFGLTVAVTVAASTFTALTLTPMLCSRLLRASQHRGILFSWSEKGFVLLEKGYHRVLHAAFRRRGLTVLVGFLAFLLGLAAFKNIHTEFAPMEDRSRLMLVFETPEGATLRETLRLAEEIEKILAETPEVSHQFLGVGMAQAGPGKVNQGLAFVTLIPRQERELHQTEIMQKLRNRFAQLHHGRVFVLELTPGGMGGSPIEVVLKHHDLDLLADVQDTVMSWMRGRPENFVGVRTNLELNKPHLDIVVNREKAAENLISIEDISNTLRFFFGITAIGQVERGAERYDVVTDVVGRGNLTPAILNSLYVRGMHGHLVSLDNLVRVHESIGPSEIHRYNRMRSATVSSSTPPGVPLGQAVRELEDYLKQNMPAGMNYELAGMSQIFEESFYYLGLTLVLAVVFIFLVLSAQFESFVYPIVIMAALPLATVGAFGILWLLNMPLSAHTYIGLIMLLGLVTKNAILLVDFTNVLVGRGYEPMEGAKEAAKSRFRPVLMTAFSTILGIMPIALGYGAGGEVRSPLGFAVAAGLFTSTFLTLVVVPVFYTIINQVREGFRRKLGWEEKRPVYGSHQA